MMIDTHCHLDYEDYDNLEEVINKMGNNIIIVSGASGQGNKNVIELCKKYENIYGTIGIHPEEIDEDIEENLKFVEENINSPKIVGIGEIGLDYYYSKDRKETQKKYFKKQLEFAKKYKKCVVIHSRDSIEETYEILKESGHNKVNIHCFSGSLEMAEKFVKLGYCLGIGGVLTFKNASKLKEVVKNIDLSHLLLETDSPYLTPEPYRGKKNEPYNISFVAQEIAKIKNISQEEVFKITTENAKRQFDLD